MSTAPPLPRHQTQQDAVTHLCREIVACLELWAHRERSHAYIIPEMNCLTLAEWRHILDRLEIR